MTASNLPEINRELEDLRIKLNHGDNTSQLELDNILHKLEEYKSFLRSNEKDEIFDLVDKQGNILDLTAPRWLCHLLGLRHTSVHVLLRWQSPHLGKVYILQIRSWVKSDSPGHLDISVGGHVVGNAETTIETAYKEMKEELGIDRLDLRNTELHQKAGYESYNFNEREHFYNSEWRDIFVGDVKTNIFNIIRFSDNEVVGLYLCPVVDTENLLNQKIIPLASALKLSLPKCM